MAIYGIKLFRPNEIRNNKLQNFGVLWVLVLDGTLVSIVEF